MNQINSLETRYIFTDAATSPQAEIAIGVFVCLDQKQVNALAHASTEMLYGMLDDKIQYQQYHSKKSTWSEIQTVIHALHAVPASVASIEIYTDCQSVCDLAGKRKEKLEKNHFMTRAGRELQHADLYKAFYALIEKYQVKVIKIKGHNPASKQLSWQERVFAVLDKVSRKKLRQVLSV